MTARSHINRFLRRPFVILRERQLRISGEAAAVLVFQGALEMLREASEPGYLLAGQDFSPERSLAEELAAHTFLPLSEVVDALEVLVNFKLIEVSSHGLVIAENSRLVRISTVAQVGRGLGGRPRRGETKEQARVRRQTEVDAKRKQGNFSLPIQGGRDREIQAETSFKTPPENPLETPPKTGGFKNPKLGVSEFSGVSVSRAATAAALSTSIGYKAAAAAVPSFETPREENPETGVSTKLETGGFRNSKLGFSEVSAKEVSDAGAALARQIGAIFRWNPQLVAAAMDVSDEWLTRGAQQVVELANQRVAKGGTVNSVTLFSRMIAESRLPVLSAARLAEPGAPIVRHELWREEWDGQEPAMQGQIRSLLNALKHGRRVALGVMYDGQREAFDLVGAVYPKLWTLAGKSPELAA